MAPINSFISSLTGLTALSACICAVVGQDGSSKVIESEVLILGGGMTGVAAAHSLYHDSNIKDFLIVEARHELGGRVQDDQIGIARCWPWSRTTDRN
jgi:polyamine oxidase